MNIKTGNITNPFSDEYIMKDCAQSVDESTEMMRLRANQRVQQINQQVREQNKLEFLKYYNEWDERTSVYSDERVVTNDPAYKSMIAMGRKAVPFIYEMIQNENIVLNGVLEQIYGCRYELEQIVDPFDTDDEERLKNFWLRKIEQEGDI